LRDDVLFVGGEMEDRATKGFERIVLLKRYARERIAGGHWRRPQWFLVPAYGIHEAYYSDAILSEPSAYNVLRKEKG
jgi:hypothetical protein